jgi:membrane protease YdiL (CAAX protease family)
VQHEASAPIVSPEPYAAPEAASDPQLFQHWEHRRPASAERIPNFSHFALFCFFTTLGWLASALAAGLAVHFHLFGLVSLEKAKYDVHLTLGIELITYLVTLSIAWFVFPLLWQKSFLAGVHWNGAKALRLRMSLFFTAFLCFLLAMLSGLLIQGPKDAPIDKILHSPGAPWLMFAFGVTIAPLFEELFFRGFFLPMLCTACDWVNEKIQRTIPPLPDENGHPRWSLSAMLVAALFTSFAFAAIHLAQTGYSWGSFALLLCVSLVLSAVRLLTRSLAASVFVHALYNFLLFALMLAGTSGFQHLEKM